MTVDTPAASAAERSYDRALIAGAKPLAVWGPGFLRKHEGLWRTREGVFVLAERAEGDDRVSYRVVEEEQAVAVLRERGRTWRAGQVERRAAAEAAADAAEGEQDGEAATGEAEEGGEGTHPEGAGGA